jgi:glucosyl-3-phosphoglycerate phosphatase
MTRLVLWRHGNTDFNASDRVQGQTDTPLNELGRAQAAAAAPMLAALRPAAIYSSDLSRARDTAAILSDLCGLSVVTDARLRERYFGTWQGMTLTEIAATYPTEYAAWRAGDGSPGCEIESLDDMGKRVGMALLDIADAWPGATVVVATHGGAARQGAGQLLGWPAPVLRTVMGLFNCHWTELRHDARRGWQLRAHNVGV